MKSNLRLVTPDKNRTVAPKRVKNTELRTREYLTEAEVERLIEAAKANRWVSNGRARRRSTASIATRPGRRPRK
jgi:hypothetical protein